MIIVADNQWYESSLEEHHRRKGTCNPAVALLERMDLCEPVVEPGCLDLGPDTAGHVLLVPIQEPLHLLLDLERRRILVNGAVGGGWIVRMGLPNATQGLGRELRAELIYRLNVRLVPH